LYKIVLLCGGKGTRLKPLTESIPKPLVPLNGKPVLEYLMNFFSKQGFNDFIVCTGYKSELVEKSVNGFAKKNWNLKFVDSGESASMLKRIIDASKFCEEKFLVCYGDTIADINIKELLEFHKSKNSSLTNVLYQMQSPFGLMETHDGKVVKYNEKPLLPFWFNIGFFVFEKKILNNIPDGDWVGFLNNSIKSGKMFALKHYGEHITFNTEHEKTEAEKKIGFFSQVLD